MKCTAVYGQGRPSLSNRLIGRHHGLLSLSAGLLALLSRLEIGSRICGSPHMLAALDLA